ncbi:MAG: hypothetical protein CMG21_02175 [Candidatus Marinimicrobia bacterium]|nr:hypothetical protein [Candidatus Neomarinimicrobiota bacterium]|tara:strand:+ start:439 stop:711 length:273 start_codon:yes stop_codon:yes gene_type:complete
MKNLRKKLMKLEYLNEVCVHSPSLLIDTKCGVGRYKFNKIGYQNDKLIIEVKLLMDSANRDITNIVHTIGNKCYLTVDQFLYALKFYASA